ncbi:uncharacterized protein LOC131149222 isoform X2 [Malania oleifera]|uniref:uncharacterized protein LOC131149222 isoform X2 n=1 Tax=Malania oleifera TaxID=397392 RepID=UPI0025AE24D8|nr:uncharacterized protein LOC131149222 isoform X2 [Malania oleifera]
MEEGRGDDATWSTAVEDLVDAGDMDGAISLLESLVSKFDISEPSASNLQLASALTDLANLYSSKGFSLKADDALSRASLIKLRSQHVLPSPSDAEIRKSPEKEDCISPQNDGLPRDSSAPEGEIDDDWEAIADRAPDELLSPQCSPGVSMLSLEDAKVQTSKRRGRGRFSYKEEALYSDWASDGPKIADSGDEPEHHNLECKTETRYRYGTHHVLVLADFPPTTKTIKLEKLFENFRDCVVIRWVNDTVALAVFRTPSIACEAYSCVHCPFTVRILDENDTLLSSIPTRDLEPPRPRPETSVRTARRLIAQGMGLKLPSASLGAREELWKQEEARRKRIVTRQNMREDAWGADD